MRTPPEYLSRLEHLTVNQGVVGSSPTSGAKFQSLAAMRGFFLSAQPPRAWLYGQQNARDMPGHSVLHHDLLDQLNVYFAPTVK